MSEHSSISKIWLCLSLDAAPSASLTLLLLLKHGLLVSILLSWSERKTLCTVEVLDV